MKKTAEPDVIIGRKTLIRKQENINEHYSVSAKPLGRGSYGAVHACVHRITKQTRAVKIVAKYKVSNVEAFLNEVELLRVVDHPNIIRLYEWFESKNHIYLITELCTGGELFEKITLVGHFNEHIAANIFKQMVSAVNHCFNKKICHKDLKPENFLFASGEPDSPIKLIDFGLSQIFALPSVGSIRMKDKVGSPYYVAPEVIEGDYDERCDIWSMGVVLYVLISGAPPFYGPNDEAILKSVQRGVFEFDLPIWNSVSKECKDLICRMITVPSKRLTPAQILEHPWLKKFADKQQVTSLPPLVTNSLKLFSVTQKVKKVVLTYLATQLSEKETAELRKLFTGLDKNGDGVLSTDEIMDGIKGRADEKELSQIMESIDTDQSGFIDYNEFLAASLNEDVYMDPSRLLQAFKMFDKDKSGTIDAAELKEVLNSELGTTDESIWLKIIKDADLDGDGQIDFEEFLKMMYTSKNDTKAR